MNDAQVVQKSKSFHQITGPKNDLTHLERLIGRFVFLNAGVQVTVRTVFGHDAAKNVHYSKIIEILDYKW
jgi:hypothetical protein